MARDLGLGDAVFAYHDSQTWERRRNDDKPIEVLDVVAETKVSWVIRRGESYNPEYKLPKKLVREIMELPAEQRFIDIHVQNARHRFYLNRDAVDAVAWISRNRHTITQAVDRCTDPNALKTIGRILGLTLPASDGTTAP